MRAICSLSLLAIVLLAGRSAAADEFPKGTYTMKIDGKVWAVTFDGMGKYKFR